MAVGVPLRERVPPLVEERAQVPGAAVDDALAEQVDQLAQAGRDAGIGPGAVKRGVRLQHVEVGVHRLGGQHVAVGEAELLRRRPVGGARLEVAAVRLVVSVPLEQLVHPPRRRQAAGVGRRQVVLRQRVDRERLPVHLLVPREWPSVGIHEPHVPAVHAVAEVLFEIRVRAPRQVEVPRSLSEKRGGPRYGRRGAMCIRPREPPAEGGERPQQPGVEHQPLGRAGAHGAAVVHLADEAAPLPVEAALPPERQQVAAQLVLDRLSQRRRVHRALLTGPHAPALGADAAVRHRARLPRSIRPAARREDDRHADRECRSSRDPPGHHHRLAPAPGSGPRDARRRT